MQALRGIAAMMIVLIHMVAAEHEYGGGPSLVADYPDFAFAALDFFFLFSGFVLMRAAMARPYDFRGGLQFLVRRLARIYPVYWIVLTGFIALYGGNWLIFGEPVELGNIVADYLLLPTGERPFLIVSWTLTHEMYFYLVFSLFLLAGRTWLMTGIGLWAVLVAVGYAAGWQAAGPVAGVLFHPYTFDFLLGTLIARLVLSGVRAYARPALAVGIAWLSLLAWLRMMTPLTEGLQETAFLSVFIAYGVPAAAIVYGAAALEAERVLFAPRLLAAIGERSYTLYLVHIPVMMVTGKLLSKFSGPGLADNVLFYGIWALAVAAGCWLFYLLVERPVTLYTDKGIRALFRERGMSPGGAVFRIFRKA